MMADRPLTSVVIPCYNQAHFVTHAIESVLAQTYAPIEVIVIDDGSLDNTAEIVARYAQVRSLRQTNEGLARARNAGFRTSKGDYTVFLDADDQLTPSAIESHLRCFAENPEAGFVVGDIDHMSVGGSYVYSPRWPILQEHQYRELLRANHVANTIAVMFRRATLERLGGFDPQYSPAEDYEILLRSARLFPSAHHRNVVALYRRYPASLSRNGPVMLSVMHRIMQKELSQVGEDRELRAAWQEGNRYWRDHFGVTTIKQLLASLRRIELISAMSTLLELLKFTRTRLLLLPWKKRRQIWDALSARFHTAPR